MTQNAFDDELDTRGLLCPLPVLKTRKKLKQMQGGSVLRVLADDPAALIDIPHFCAEQNHALIGDAQQPDGTLVFDIRNGPGS